MVEAGASDLHLSAGSPPLIRQNGDMMPLSDHPTLANADVQELVFEILNEKQKRQFIENWELDCSYFVEGLSRFRVNVFMQRRGMGGVFRVIPTEIKSAAQLGLPEQVTGLLHTNRGLILVTGPTGSGKSTTLAAMLHTINLERREHILTIEDPIEFVHENRKSLINQREVSSHTKSFKNALKAALREDPDIILVGEMRDLETIELALTAAETGHLVFGTLHTNSAASTIDRVIDVFPADRQDQIRVMLSESLRGVIAQSLFKRQDKPGRVAVIEVLVNMKAVANLIREGKTFQIPSSMQTGSEFGMLTFEQSCTKLVEEGLVSQEDAEGFLGKKLRNVKNNAAQELKTSNPRGISAISPQQKHPLPAKPAPGTASGPRITSGGPERPASATKPPGGVQPTGPTQGPPPAAKAPNTPPEATGVLRITSEEDPVPKKKSGLLGSFGLGKKSS